MTEIVLPAQTNPLGKLLGGQVMHLVDMAGALAAHRHSNSYVVTASVDYIDFRNPVNLGEIVNFKSQVNRVFHTSMEVGVEVYSENAMTGERKHTTTAYVAYEQAEAGSAADLEDSRGAPAIPRSRRAAQDAPRTAVRDDPKKTEI
jgi:acyl-CoA hydrolase